MWKTEVTEPMKHRWTTLLWELWAAQAACAAASFFPQSGFCTLPELVLPALALSVAVPAAWAVWGVWGELPLPPEPEQLLEPGGGCDLAALLEQACAIPG